jgi:hypothetical protein
MAGNNLEGRAPHIDPLCRLLSTPKVSSDAHTKRLNRSLFQLQRRGSESAQIFQIPPSLQPLIL